MRPKIILGDLIWSDIRVFVARRIMLGRPTLNLCMHSNNRVMLSANWLYQFAIHFMILRSSVQYNPINGTPIPFTDLGNALRRVT